jgi:hypothetical protein
MMPLCACGVTLYLPGATAFPTLSYGAAESKGDLLSQSNGIWGNAEFGYNPLNNNLGASVSSGTTGSANILSSDSVGGGPGGLVGQVAALFERADKGWIGPVGLWGLGQ